jgi:5-methylthioadenosine/S-adenosylhomocysteine deaminase
LGDSLLIRGGLVLTMNPAREKFVGDVLIQGGRIAKVGQNLGDDLPASGTLEIDASGMYVLPGFVQTHVHLCQTLFRGQAEGVELSRWLGRIWALESAHDAQSMYWSALLGCYEMLRSGTTCVLDMGSVRHTDQVFKAVSDVGIRAFAGKAMMDSGDSVPEGLRESTEESIAGSLRLHSEWHGAAEGRIRYAFAPRFLESCSEKLLRTVAEKAREMGLLVHSHASETVQELKDCRAQHGMSPVAYLASLGLAGPNLVLAHCVNLEDEDFKVLASTATRVAHCPSSNLKLSSGIADVGRLVRSGAKISLGCDGAPCNNNLDMVHEMRTAALLQSYKNGSEFSWADLFLEAATIGGAEALGASDAIGSIEPGKRADIIAIDVSGAHTFCGEGCSPEARIVFAARGSDVRLVVVDGKLIFRGRHFLRGLEEDAVAMGATALENLLSRGRLT